MEEKKFYESIPSRSGGGGSKAASLKQELAARAAGHERRLTDIKNSTTKRLQGLRKILNEADESTLDTLQVVRGHGHRPSKPLSADLGGPHSLSSHPSSPNRTKRRRSSSSNSPRHEINRRSGSYSPRNEGQRTSSRSPIPPAPRRPDVQDGKPQNPTVKKRVKYSKRTQMAGNLALTVLKSYHTTLGYHQSTGERQQVDKLAQKRNLKDSTALRQELEEKIEALQEKNEDLCLEVKALVNEQKDASRRYKEQVLTSRNKFVARIRAQRTRIQQLERELSHNRVTIPKHVADANDPSTPTHRKRDAHKSSQFDQVIPSLFYFDSETILAEGGDDNTDDEDDEDAEEAKKDSRAPKPKHQREVSELSRLEDRAQELEIEVETWRAKVNELKAQFTMEKSRRLNAMWSLEAKSRQVHNLLTVQEAHNKLVPEFHQVVVENEMLKNKLEQLNPAYATVGLQSPPPAHGSAGETDLARKLDETRETKYKLLQSYIAEIYRLKAALRKASGSEQGPSSATGPSDVTVATSSWKDRGPRVTPTHTRSRTMGMGFSKKKTIQLKPKFSKTVPPIGLTRGKSDAVLT